MHRHRVLLLPASALLTLAVQAYQAYAGTRVGSLTDVVADTVGAATGLGAAVLCLRGERVTARAAR